MAFLHQTVSTLIVLRSDRYINKVPSLAAATKPLRAYNSDSTSKTEGTVTASNPTA